MSAVRIVLDGCLDRGGRGSGFVDRGEYDRLVRTLDDPVQREAIGKKSGFIALPYWSQKWLAAARDAQPVVDADTILVVGIGGSALGARAVANALGTPARRLVVLDNIDPHTVDALLAGLTPARTVVALVSKSGGTLETAALAMVVIDWMTTALGKEEVAGRVVAVTGSKGGALRTWAARTGWRILEIPENVGGRYSVLTPAGLYPLVAAGVDVESLLEGANDAMNTGTRDAARLAALLHLLDRGGGRSVQVVWPYGDRLWDLGAWFLQLWGESLGKRTGEDVPVGSTPLLVRGTTDQHSQLQLYMEGPEDKVFFFWHVETTTSALEIPSNPGTPPEYRYLEERPLDEVFRACRQATSDALLDAGKPCLSLILDDLSAHSVGYLLQLLMLATALAGTAYGVNPFDQPGVEAGKVLTRTILGADRQPEASPSE